MPPPRINPKTLEFIVNDKDLQRARIIAVLKAAANTTAFQQLEKKEPGKHHILAVQLGNETFNLEEQPRKLAPQPTLHDVSLPNKPATVTLPTKKYEGNINTMNVACSCGQTHNLGTAPEFRAASSQYTDNQRGLGGDTSGTTYNPAATENTPKKLYENTSSGNASYSGNNFSGTAGYAGTNTNGTTYTDKKKKPVDY
ncbi:MAG TPA: hypothetical protein VJB87_03870 [Candidatus Nanoarchaeia archaeon]|nr:hypothetical protein [Candidatus Nanoarchaeia archaeon]